MRINHIESVKCLTGVVNKNPPEESMEDLC
jgi:hypothetical protein